MGKEFKNIEDLFKSKFEDYQVQPSEQLWGNINSKLKIQRFLNSGLLKHIGFSVIAAIVALTIQFNGNNIAQDTSEKEISQKSIIVKNSFVKKENNNQDTQEIKKEKNNYYAEQNQLQLTKKEKNIKYQRDREFAPIIISKSIKLIESSESQISKEQIKLTTPAPPIPVFSLNSKEGCVPFTVKINNLSKAAVAYEWDFGDGNQSDGFKPLHTYRYPGVYKITLKAKGVGGVAITYIDSIIVHEKPHAEIFWPYETEVLTGQKIQIPNYSKNADKVEWNFGDNHTSNEKTGQHIFKQNGQYNICMKVWSETGCIDSAVLNNIHVIDINEKIVFPNAFTPNLDGPASGYYNPADVYNDVFYPKYKGEIEEYELRIFSKFGVEVFKSNDVSYGWNGYYQNHLMPEGVYVYIVHGKFEGNQKFNLKGDVTLLHKK